MNSPKIPNSLIKLTNKLFSDNDEREKFLSCFEQPPEKESAAILLRENGVNEIDSKYDFFPPWAQPLTHEQGTKNCTLFDSEAHDRGDYYVLDPSSVFAAIPVIQLQRPSIIFDACAAPGGKSAFAWRAHRPDLLIANEFVEKRLKPLISNLQRCRIQPSEVFHLPTRRVGEMFPESFPLVMVDAPCSGQSLLLKGERVDGAFHPQTINGNLKRQRRILAELAPSVAPQGHLLYMTCTFSLEENEEIIEWFLKKFPSFKSVPVRALENYRSPHSDHYGYRLWPQQNKGAGSFTSLLINTQEGEPTPLPKDYKPVWRNS